MEKQIQRFNVVCVTKRHLWEEECRNPNLGISWHQPIKGEAELVTETKEIYGVKYSNTKVWFQGDPHELTHVRSGLDGTAVTIGIAVNDFPFTAWELYTDTPAEPESGQTPEKIRKKAESAVKHTKTRR